MDARPVVARRRAWKGSTRSSPEFLVESHENLDQLDRDLLALEQNPGSRELLAGVFRTIHTIKGTSGFLAFDRLEKLTHVGENLLGRLRDGRIELTDAALPARCSRWSTPSAACSRTSRRAAGRAARTTPSSSRRCPPCSRTATGRGPAADRRAVPAQRGPGAQPRRRLAMEQGGGDDRPIGSILVEHGAAAPAAVAAGHSSIQANGRRSVADSSVRVDVELLDSLARLVGELVLARNELVPRPGRPRTARILVRA